MKTKASVFRFPLHALFVAIAFGALLTSLVLDVMYLAQPDPAWARASFVAATVGALALFASMVPGFIDYFVNVPREGEVWKHAHVHMVFGVALVGYFIIGAAARWPTLPEPDVVAAYGAAGLSIFGFVGLLAQGYIGRGLVLRHFLGVDKDGVPERPPEDEPPAPARPREPEGDRRRGDRSA